MAEFPTNTDISVLLATRNRAASLAQCLESLTRQVDPPAWQLVVCDNGSTDETANVLKKYSDRLPLCHVHEPMPGKSRSLNLAIRQAQGELLVFADDDIRTDRKWLSAYWQAAKERPDINIFGGRILVDRERVPAWIRQSYNLQAILLTEQDFGPQEKVFGFDEYPVGPGLAVRKKILQSLDDPWPVNVGPGTCLPVGDEVLFLRKLSAPRSTDRLYVPASIVYHEFNQSNLRLVNSLRRCYLGGYAAGLHGGSAGSRQNDNPEKLINKVWKRLRTCHSLRELMCMVSRATGYYIGTRHAVPGAVRIHEPFDRHGS